jgi:hypothetical protein
LRHLKQKAKSLWFPADHGITLDQEEFTHVQHRFSDHANRWQRHAIVGLPRRLQRLLRV